MTTTQAAAIPEPGPLPKAATGIEGLDDITSGGLPRHRATMIVGDAGAGKTILALQILIHGARDLDEPGIMVSFEEHTSALIANSGGFGNDIPALVRSDQLFFLDACVSSDMVRAGAFDLAGVIAGVSAKASEMGARRIVFDGIDVLLSLLDNPAAERHEMRRLHDWLIESGFTAIITAKATAGVAGDIQRYGFMQYTVDCCIQLSQHVTDRVALREIRVIKYRGSEYAENAFPMILGPLGMEIAGPAVGAVDHDVSAERITSGIASLDEMLGGGYLRGSSILVSGSPGTAKTTLANLFLEAHCRRAERALYVSFDEVTAEVVRNMGSVGVSLGTGIDSGLLRMFSARTDARSAEGHFLTMKRLIVEHRPRAVVIDPLSALVKAGGSLSAIGVAQRLLRHAKALGVTVLCTSLLEADETASESTAIQVSTFADTWIQLSYVIRGGERNRALTICKARGTQHSNQVRELVLSSEGVTLTDVYLAGGEVLMGTARWERETAELDQLEQQRQATARKRADLVNAEAETVARMEGLARELEARRQALVDLKLEEEALVAQQAGRHASRLALRGKGVPGTSSVKRPPEEGAAGGRTK